MDQQVQMLRQMNVKFDRKIIESEREKTWKLLQLMSGGRYY